MKIGRKVRWQVGTSLSGDLTYDPAAGHGAAAINCHLATSRTICISRMLLVSDKISIGLIAQLVRAYG